MQSLRKTFLLTLLTLLTFTAAKAQEFSLPEVWASPNFFPRGVSGMKHLSDGQHYTRLISSEDKQHTAIVRYQYESEKAVDTLFTTRSLGGQAFPVEGYELSKSLNFILLKTDVTPIYRHSEKAKVYVLNRETQEILPLQEAAAVMYPTFAPDEQKVAYVYENNLFILDLKTKQVRQVTHDGEENHILNGRSDWVYEEEFKLVRAYEWSPESNHLAYIRFDESGVKEYQLKVYQNNNYPDLYTYKYPKVGEDNSQVGLHVYSLKANQTTEVDLGDETDFYLPRIKWTQSGNVLTYQYMNRLQNELQLFAYNVKDRKQQLLLKEESKYYVDVHDNLHFLADGRFLWTSEKDGFNHLYLHEADGKQARQLTQGEWDLHSLDFLDEKGEKVYYTASEKSPMDRHVYEVDFEGKKKLFSPKKSGTYKVTFSKNGDYYFLNHEDANKPATIEIHQRDGNFSKVLEDNAALIKRMEDKGFVEKEFFEIETEEGVTLNAWMMKPPNFKKRNEYPVLMTVYGGPGSQTVLNSFGSLNYVYHQYLVAKGYIVVSVDNRGTGARGEEFKKMTYLRLGELETKDQLEAARYLANEKYVDEDRIGIFGWSYGGYMSLLSLMQGNDIIKTAVAVAPVTDWRFYDNIYTERYMQTPESNEKGYQQSAVMPYVKNLKGNLLLVHGTFDDNVHPQHSMELINEMVRQNKRFDSEFYPNKNHGIYGGLTRLHLFDRITRFLDENL